MEPEELMDMLSKMAGHSHEEEDYSKWVQVGKLSPEEALKKRELDRQLMLIRQEDATLFAKHKALEAQARANGHEWWNSLYKNHSLPDADYHIQEDGAIVMEPGSEEKRKKNR